MSIFDATVSTPPSAELGAQRVKRTLAQTFSQIEGALTQVRQIVKRHGRSSINSALGADQKQAINLYKALKTVVEQNKPGTSIPDLPS